MAIYEVHKKFILNEIKKNIISIPPFMRASEKNLFHIWEKIVHFALETKLMNEKKEVKNVFCVKLYLTSNHMFCYPLSQSVSENSEIKRKKIFHCNNNDLPTGHSVVFSIIHL